jgi:hypothetical protein
VSDAVPVIDPTAGGLPPQRWDEIMLFHDRFYRDQDAHMRWAETAKRAVDYFEGRQWSAANMAKLTREGRPILTINKIRPLVNLVLGYHLNNQIDRKALPTNDATGTADMARVMSHTLKNISDINELRFVDAEVHLDGIVAGRGWWEIQTDYSENVLGECSVTAVDPFMVLPDCDGQEYNPNGPTHTRISKVDWVSVDEIEAWYGVAAAQRIAPLAAYGATQSAMPLSVPLDIEHVTPMRTFGMLDGRNDATRMFRERGAEWADTYRKLVRRLNIQHYVRTWRWAMVDLETGDRRWVPDHWGDNMRAEAVAWAEANGIPIALQNVRTRRLRWTHIIGDTVVFDRWSEYGTMTLVPFFPYFRRGITQGMVEPLLSVQDEINVRRAARLNIVMRAANSGWMAEKGTLTAQERRNLELNGGRAGFVLEYDTKNRTLNPPTQITPQQSPVSIAQLEAEAETDMQEIAGINKAALGQSEGANTSGRAVLARQQQTVIGLEMFRSNWQRSVRLTGMSMMGIVQDFYTQPRLIRIVGENQSNPISMMINVRAAEGVINDVTQGRYSITVDETSLTDAFLDAQFNELLTMMQQGIPVPPEFLIDASSIGRKEELRAAIAAANAAAAAAGVPPGGAAPADGKGAPAAPPPQPGPPAQSNPPQPRLPT